MKLGKSHYYNECEYTYQAYLPSYPSLRIQTDIVLPVNPARATGMRQDIAISSLTCDSDLSAVAISMWLIFGGVYQNPQLAFLEEWIEFQSRASSLRPSGTNVGRLSACDIWSPGARRGLSLRTSSSSSLAVTCVGYL